MKWTFFIACSLCFISAKAIDKPAYQIFDKKGKAVSFEKMAAGVQQNQVVMFGEYHDDPIIHWLQFNLTRRLYDDKKGKLILGAEMFEADMQTPLTAYIKGETDEKVFKESVTSLWKNYNTDYKPLVEFAKSKSIPFIATNIPRYIARYVYKNGFSSLDTLQPEIKKLLPPLPLPYQADLPGYKAMLEMSGGHGGENLPKSQASKDATMAYHISKALTGDYVQYTFIHYNGTYHSDGFEGIVWYLKQYNATLTVSTISAVRQKDVTKLEKEHIGKADFVICVDEEMTRTH